MADTGLGTYATALAKAAKRRNKAIKAFYGDADLKWAMDPGNPCRAVLAYANGERYAEVCVAEEGESHGGSGWIEWGRLTADAVGGCRVTFCADWPADALRLAELAGGWDAMEAEEYG